MACQESLSLLYSPRLVQPLRTPHYEQQICWPHGESILGCGAIEVH